MIKKLLYYSFEKTFGDKSIQSLIDAKQLAMATK